MPCPSRILCRDCLTFCPATSSRQVRCPTCKAQLNRNRVKSWRASNPDKRRKAAARWRQRHPDYHAGWRNANRERRNAYNREHYRRDPAQFLNRARRSDRNRTIGVMRLASIVL